MIIWRSLTGAIAGWTAILRGRDGWAERFRLTPAGLIAALVIFALVALLTTLAENIGLSVPEVGIAVPVLWELASMGLVVLAAVLMKLALRSAVPMLKLAVPIIYAMAGLMVVRALLVAVYAPLAPLVLLVLGFMLYRLGRMAGPWSRTAGAAFGVLSIALLVGLPWTLYMLTNTANSPI